MDNSTFIVMLARQRSGTNPLRSVLDAHPDVFCSPEIFHPQPSPEAHLEVEMNYFEFLERHLKGDIKQVLTSLDSQERVFLDYLSYLRCFSDKRYVLLDVKYNSTHTLDGPWREVSREPELFLLIRRHGLRVLNLTRRNYLRYYLSWLKANESDRWTIDAGADGDDPVVTVDPDAMIFHLELCRSENDAIAASFSEYPRYLEVEYDDLFPELGEPPSREELARIAAWLAIPPAFPAEPPRYRKQAVRPLGETIANYGEVVEALRGTPFEYCLDDERMHAAAARA